MKVHRFHENLGQQQVRVTVAEGICMAIKDKGQPILVSPPYLKELLAYLAA